MNIAVAYEDGQIFLHFGHCPIFAIYTTDEENKEIVTKRLIEVDVVGHQAVADLMGELNIDFVICGNIGSEGRKALAEYGIIAYAGFEGNADTAADMLVSGELPFIPDGGACSHHHDGGCCCHSNDESSESCGCGNHNDDGGCGCGCHG